MAAIRVYDLSREVSGALGIAVIGSIVTGLYRSHLNLPGAAAAVLAAITVASLLTADLRSRRRATVRPGEQAGPALEPGHGELAAAIR